MLRTDERIAEMNGRLRKYLEDERAGARWQLGLSLPCFLAGALVLLSGFPPFWQGLGWPLLLLGGIQLWTGRQGLRESRRLNDRLPLLLQKDPPALARQEVDRMADRLTYLQRLRLTALSVVIFGIMLALTGGLIRPSSFTLGLGMGCCLPGAIMLVLAISSHWRNEMYAYELQSFAEKFPLS